MNSIKRALADELDSKTLSAQKRQDILRHKKSPKKVWLPKFVAVCMVAIALFLVVTTFDQKVEHPIRATAPLGPVDEAIVHYFNNEATRETSDFYNGDGYLLRLALEKNSRMFYEDSSLSPANRQLVSELLHYIQEASWQGDVAFSLQPVATIEEMVMLAPGVIAELKPQVTMKYVTIADEKKQRWNLYRYDVKAWLNYVFVLALLLFAIVKLARGKHWIIMTCCIFLTIVAAYQPFEKRYQDIVAYDEYKLIEVVENSLKKAHVKVNGEPVLQYAATIHGTRSALVAFDDMKVLATFSYNQGQYVKERMSWHTGDVLQEISFDLMDEPTQRVTSYGFAKGHDVAKIQARGDEGYSQEMDMTPNEPTIIFHKQPQELSSYNISFLDENGHASQ